MTFFDNFRKRLMSATALCSGVLLAAVSASQTANAGPTGGNVQSGSATISGSSSNLSITQTSERAYIDWSKFDVDAGDRITFWHDPNFQHSITVNRDTSGIYSQINGTLLSCMSGSLCSPGAANGGSVWIINPAGVTFGNGARVDVGGLLATTANIDPSDFANSLIGVAPIEFTGTTNNGGIFVDAGANITGNGSLIALVAPEVRVNGDITNANGDILLGSTQDFLLNVRFVPAGQSKSTLELFEYQVDTFGNYTGPQSGSSNANGLTINGTLTSERIFGSVVSVVDSVLNVNGTLNATGVTSDGETISLIGDGCMLNDGSGIQSGIPYTIGKVDTKIGSNAQLNAAQGVTSVMGDSVLIDQALTLTDDLRLISLDGGIQLNGALNVGGNAELATTGFTGGDIKVGNITAGGTATLSSFAGNVTASDIKGGNVFVAGETGVTVGTVQARAVAGQTPGDATVTSSAGNVTTGDVTADGFISIAGQNATTGSLSANAGIIGFADKTFTSNGPINAGDFALVFANDLKLKGNTTAGTDLTLMSLSGDIEAKDLSAGGNLSTQSAGNTSIGQQSAGGTLTNTATGTLTVTGKSQATGDITMDAGSLLHANGDITSTAGKIDITTRLTGIDLQNLNAGTDILLNSNGATSVGTLTAGGDINTQSRLGFTITGKSLSGGDTTVSASSITLSDAMEATGGSINLGAASGDLSTTTLKAGGNIQTRAFGNTVIESAEATGTVTGTAGAITINSDSNTRISGAVTGKGDVTISGLSVTLNGDTTSSTGSIDLKAQRGNIIAQNLNAQSDITTYSGLQTSIVSQTAQTGDISALAGTNYLVSGNTTSGQDLDVNASAISFSNAPIVARDLTLKASGAISTPSLAAGRDISVTSGRGFSIDGLVDAGRDLSVDAQAINLKSGAKSGSDMTLVSKSTVDAPQLDAVGDLSGTATGKFAITGTTTAAGIQVDAGEIDLQGTTRANTGDLGLKARTGNIVTQDLVSAQDISLDASGNLTMLNLQAGGNISTQSGGNTRLTSLQAGGAITGNADRNYDVSGDVTAEGDVSLSAGQTSTTETFGLVVKGNVLSNKGGVSLVSSHDVQTEAVTAAGSTLIEAKSGSIDAGADVQAGGDATLKSDGDIQVQGDVIGGGKVLLASASGNSRTENISAGSDLEVSVNGNFVAEKLSAGWDISTITTGPSSNQFIKIAEQTAGGEINAQTSGLYEVAGDSLAGGDFNLNYSGRFAFGGEVRSTGGGVKLEAQHSNVVSTAQDVIAENGNVTITGNESDLNTGNLSASKGNVFITLAGDIAVDGDISTMESLQITRANNLSVTGDIVTGTNVNLTARKDIKVGNIQSGNISTESGGDTHTGSLTTLGTGTGIEGTAGGSFTVDGNISSRNRLIVDASGIVLKGTTNTENYIQLLSKGGITTGDLVARTSITLETQSSNPLGASDDFITIKSQSAGTNITARTGGAYTVLGDTQAGNGIALNASDTFHFGGMLKAKTGDISLQSQTLGGHNTAKDIIAEQGNILITGNAGSLEADSLTSKTGSVRSGLQGDITIKGNVEAADIVEFQLAGGLNTDASLSIGGKVNAGSDIKFTVGKDINTGDLDSGGSITTQSGGNTVLASAKALGDVVANAGGSLEISRASQGITPLKTIAGGDIKLTAGTDISTGDLVSGGTITTQSNGNTVLASVDARRDILADAAGNFEITGKSKSGKSFKVSADGNIKTGDIEAGLAIETESGGDTVLASADSARGIMIEAGGNLEITGQSKAALALTASADGNIKTGDIEAGQSIVTESGGNTLLASADAGGAIQAFADGSLEITKDSKASDSVKAFAGGDITLGGSLLSGESVVVTSEGGSVTVNDINAKNVRLTSERISGSTTLIESGPIAINGDIDALRYVLIATRGAVSVNGAVEARTALQLFGGNLHIDTNTGWLIAPEVEITAMTGSLVFGNGFTLQSGSMNVDQAEYAQILAAKRLTLTAADWSGLIERQPVQLSTYTAAGFAESYFHAKRLPTFLPSSSPTTSILVGNFGFHSGAKNIRFLTGNGGNPLVPDVKIAGSVTNGGVAGTNMSIGDALNINWQPGTILITGNLGTNTGGRTATTSDWLGSVSLAGSNVILGNQAFYDAYMADVQAGTAGSFDAYLASQDFADPAMAGHIWLAAENLSFTLADGGSLIQQNTIAEGMLGADGLWSYLPAGQDGLFALEDGSTPGQIDLFGSFVDPTTGQVIAGVAASLLDSFLPAGLTQQPAYRVNSCEIGTPICAGASSEDINDTFDFELGVISPAEYSNVAILGVEYIEKDETEADE